jgi:hypothetical protein
LGQGDPVLEFVGVSTLAIHWENVIFCLLFENGAKKIDNAENTGSNERGRHRQRQPPTLVAATALSELAVVQRSGAPPISGDGVEVPRANLANSSRTRVELRAILNAPRHFE